LWFSEEVADEEEREKDIKEAIPWLNPPQSRIALVNDRQETLQIIGFRLINVIQCRIQAPPSYVPYWKNSLQSLPIPVPV
jgi:hypothetical protein